LTLRRRRATEQVVLLHFPTVTTGRRTTAAARPWIVMTKGRFRRRSWRTISDAFALNVAIGTRSLETRIDRADDVR
jgi:hypothetical protein